MDVIKNPVIIGVFATVLTYLYLQWQIDEKNKKYKKKHNKPNKHEEEVNLIIPAVVGVIVWFIVHGYFEYSKPTGRTHNINNNTFMQQAPLPIAPPTANFRFSKEAIESVSSGTKSFSLLTGGVAVPTKLPDVLIDMF